NRFRVTFYLRRSMSNMMSSAMSAMRSWFKEYVPTSDPANLRTPPLPVEELFGYSSPSSSPGSHSSSSSSAPSIGRITPKSEIMTRGSSRVATKRRSEVSRLEDSRESSIDCPAKRTRKYQLKKDVERQNPEYQKMRQQNNEAVKKSRQRKEEKEAEEKRKSEEEKLLLRSTMLKLMKIYEWDSIVAEKERSTFFNPSPIRSNFSDMTDDELTLYESVRRELFGNL
ncbi:hypothetical protein PENTCL1PPCAC_7402, partial [Pristionchus entomophagus]